MQWLFDPALDLHTRITRERDAATTAAPAPVALDRLPAAVA
jgi:hypothetical protein